MTKTPRDQWPQLKNLVQRALDIEPADREKFLEEACGEDDSLRQEIESILRHDDEAEQCGFLDQPLPTIAHAIEREGQKEKLGHAPRKEVSPSEVGTVSFSTVESTEAPPVKKTRSVQGIPDAIGKYRVIGELDSGGQADVYRAVHPTLDKELVIKLARQPGEGSRLDMERLVAEGKLLADLDHPNLARVYDLDFYEGRPFLVMEYIRGRNLQQTTGGEPVPSQQAAVLVAKVARALAVAHAHGVVHKDIKPQNILIDPTGEPRIIDFGLAQLRDAWTEEAEEPGHISGTVYYMPPEQARGQTDQISARSDVFALGAVLYYLLTGKPPFAGRTVEHSLQLAAQCEFDREALSRRGIDQRLAIICLKAMEAEPTERFTTAEQLADALGNLTKGRILGAAASVGPIGCSLSVTLACLLLVAVTVVLLPWRLHPNDWVAMDRGASPWRSADDWSNRAAVLAEPEDAASEGPQGVPTIAERGVDDRSNRVAEPEVEAGPFYRHPSAQEFYDGLAAGIRSVGQAVHNLRLAERHRQAAYQHWLENEKRRVSLRYSKKRLHKEFKQSTRRPPLTEEQLNRINKRKLPDRLTPDQFDRSACRFSWPEALCDTDFADGRRRIEKLFASRTPERSGRGSRNLAEVREVVRELRAILESKWQSREIGPRMAIEARRFLRSVDYEAHFPAGSKEQLNGLRDEDHIPRGGRDRANLALGKLEIRVWQDDQRKDFNSAIPLRTGDDLQVVCEAPIGFYVALFWFNTEGTLHSLSLEEESRDDFVVRYVWPRADKSTSLVGPAGTELVFLCGSLGFDETPRIEYVEPLFDEGEPWPDLPKTAVLSLKEDWVDLYFTRRPGGPERDRPESLNISRAEELRNALADKYEIVRGVGFFHAEPPTNISDSD